MNTTSPQLQSIPPAAAAPARSGPDRRTQVLGAARFLWGRHGYHSVSLRGIANEAGVSLALLDHHFGAKHLLFAEALRPLADHCARAHLRWQQRRGARGSARSTQLARALLEPVWDLHHSDFGDDILRLWLQHRYDRLPEIRQPLDRATLPLMKAIADVMPCGSLSKPLWQRVKTCHMVFADGMEWLIGDLSLGMVEPANITLPPTFSFDAVQLQMALALTFGWSDAPGQPLPAMRSQRRQRPRSGQPSHTAGTT